MPGVRATILFPEGNGQETHRNHGLDTVDVLPQMQKPLFSRLRVRWEKQTPICLSHNRPGFLLGVAESTHKLFFVYPQYL